MLSLFLALSFFWIQTLSLNQICDLVQNQCVPGAVYDCNDSECSLFCDGENACTDIEFNCDDSHLHNICNITCATTNSCTGTTIHSNRDTILQCLAYDSCINNNTILDVYNANSTADISANIITHYQNAINDNYPSITCEGQGIHYCARHCMGSDQECNTFPTQNPICDFTNGNYECSYTITAPNIDYNEKIIIGQLLAFNDVSNYTLNSIQIPFAITDISWNANYVSNMEFYIIETDDDIDIDYQQIVSYCDTHNTSNFIDIYPSISHIMDDKVTQNNFYTSVSNITFVFEDDQVIIDQTNREHNFAWILLFGCGDDITYTESLSITTYSTYTGDDYNGYFAGIQSVAEYDGEVGFPKGYDYVFEMAGTERNEGLEIQSYFMYIYYETSLQPNEITHEEYASILLNITLQSLTQVTNNNNIDNIQYQWTDHEFEHGAMMNMSYCVVYSTEMDITYASNNNIQQCQTVYNEIQETIMDTDDDLLANTYFAFAIYDIIAPDTDVDVFGEFIADSLTLSVDTLSTMMKDELNAGNDEVSFEVVDIFIDQYIKQEKQSEDESTRYTAFIDYIFFSTVQYVMYGLMVLCVLLSVIGYLYSFHSGADNINAFSVILFGIYAWDFYADVVFAIAVFVVKEYEIFLISAVFILLPFTINFLILFRAHDKWIKDPSIQYPVSEWLASWNVLVMILTLVSGSAFAAVELVNSNLFPLDMFSMGLTARHIKKFSNKRLYSTVLLENIPQIAIQIYFTFWIIKDAIPDIAILAFVTSILSIVVSLIDIYWTKRMFKSIKKAHALSGGLKQLYYIEITSEEIEQKKKLLLQKPNSIKMVFAEICEIDPRCVNVILCIAIQGGVQVAFEVHSAIFQQKSSVEMLETLRHSIDCFATLIQSAWKLDDALTIFVDLVGDDEKFKGHRGKKANFSVQAKRASISSNRFMSIDINGVRSAANSVHNNNNNNDDKATPISLKEIQKITKEKREEDGESSYWGGSTRHSSVDTNMTNVTNMTNNALSIPIKLPVHFDHLHPIKLPIKLQHKKRKKANGNTEDLSIQVNTPSSYAGPGEIIYKEPMLLHGSDGTPSSVTHDTDTAPDPESMNTMNTMNIVPDERSHIANSTSVQCEMGSRRMSQSATLTLHNVDSTLAQPPSQVEASQWNANIGGLHLDYKADILITLSRPVDGPTPATHTPSSYNVNNELMSIDDQYVKPTMENMDSYNDTEMALDDIMKHVIVDQTEQLEEKEEKEQVKDDAKRMSNEHAEEHDLELNTVVSHLNMVSHTSMGTDATFSDMDTLDAMSAMTMTNVTCVPITPPTQHPEPVSPATTMANINALPPILEDGGNSSNLFICTDDEHHDEDEELELNSVKPSLHLNRVNTVDTMDTMDMVRAITASSVEPPIIMTPINVSTPVNTEIHSNIGVSPSIVSMTASSMIINNPDTPLMFENEDGKRESVIIYDDDHTQPRSANSAKIGATWVKRKSVKTSKNSLDDDDEEEEEEYEEESDSEYQMSESDEDEMRQVRDFMRIKSEEYDYAHDNTWASKQSARPRTKTMPPIYNQRSRYKPPPPQAQPPRKSSAPATRFTPRIFPFKALPNKPLPPINNHKRKRFQNTHSKHNGITNY